MATEVILTVLKYLPVVDTCTYTNKLFGITYTIHTGYKTGKIRIKLMIYINNLMVTYCGLTNTRVSWSRCTRTYYFLTTVCESRCLNKFQFKNTKYSDKNEEAFRNKITQFIFFPFYVSTSYIIKTYT